MRLWGLRAIPQSQAEGRAELGHWQTQVHEALPVHSVLGGRPLHLFLGWRRYLGDPQAGEGMLLRGCQFLLVFVLGVVGNLERRPRSRPELGRSCCFVQLALFRAALPDCLMVDRNQLVSEALVPATLTEMDGDILLPWLMSITLG